MNRHIGVDLLRLLAAFMVVMIHSLPFVDSPLSTESLSIQFLQSFVRFGLPIFFMISGAFILTSKIENIFQWYKSRVVKIGIPFLIYGFIHFQYFFRYHAVDGSPVLYYLKKIITNPVAISGHYWFVYAILGLFLIAPVLNIFFRSISMKDALKILSIISLLQTINSNFYLIEFLTGIPNIYFLPTGSIWPLYFLCGGLLYKCHTLISKRLSFVILGLGLFLTTLFTFLTPNTYGIDFKQFDTNISMLLYTSGFFLLYLKMVPYSDIKRQVVRFLSKQTYGVYLIHILVLDALITTLPYLNQPGNILIIILRAILAFIVSLGLATLINIPVNLLLELILRSKPPSKSTI